MGSSGDLVVGIKTRGIWQVFGVFGISAYGRDKKKAGFRELRRWLQCRLMKTQSILYRVPEHKLVLWDWTSVPKAKSYLRFTVGLDLHTQG